MKNPYFVLTISKDQSLKGILEQLKGFTKGNPEIFSNENYEELVSFLKKYDKETQREKALDVLVNVKYSFFSRINNKPNPQKVGQFQKSQEELKQAYEMIATEEKRKIYAEKENFSKKTTQNFLNSKIQFKIPVYTKGVLSKKEQERMRDRRKENFDPNHAFPNYTGYPYRWGVELNGKGTCIINEKDVCGRPIVVTHLGNFQYEGLIKKPTSEYPTGQATFIGEAEIIGVTKMDRENKAVKTKVVVLRLNPEDTSKNKAYLRDVVLSDGLMDRVNTNNCGFLGSIGVKNKDGIPCYYIEYNGYGDRELVSTLEIAKYTPGMVKNKDEIKTVNNFEELKEKLVQIQESYALDLIQNKEAAKGENIWQK